MTIYYVKGNSLYDDPINYEKITNKLSSKFPNAKRIFQYGYSTPNVLYYIKDGNQVNTALPDEDFYDVILQVGIEITLDAPNTTADSYVRRVQVLEFQNVELTKDIAAAKELVNKLTTQLLKNTEEISKLNSEIEKLKQ